MATPIIRIDRKKYDTRTLSTLDVFGSYFIDRYFNHMYLHACDLVSENGARNITDAFRANVINYMNGISKKTYYTTVVNQLHAFYQEKSGFNSIVLSEFENRVLGTFIPPEFYRSFTNNQKDKVLRDIIVKTANELGTVVIGRKMLPKIIDDHRNPLLVPELQDITLDILLTQRETYFIDFAKSISDSNGNDKVNRHVVDKLKQALVDEQHTRITAETDRDRALAIAQSLATTIKTMERELIELREQNARMKANVSVQTPPSKPTDQPILPQPIVPKGILKNPIVEPKPEPELDSADEDSDDMRSQREMIRNRFNTVTEIEDDRSWI